MRARIIVQANREVGKNMLSSRMEPLSLSKEEGEVSLRY